MRFIVLGGAGDVGSRAVEALAISKGVTHITICDYNGKVAETVRQRVASTQGVQCTVSVAVVDATKHADLVKAITGHDVCASALGPFHRFEVLCMKASMDAKVNYCSVCDDWNAAMGAFDLASTASPFPIIAITGFGASPGLTNMAVCLLAKEFDTVSDIEISCFQPLNAGGGEAVLRHMLFVMSGNIPIWSLGKRTFVRACSRAWNVEYPTFGKVRMWNMGHAEPVTLHRYFPKVQNVTFKMGFGFGSRLFIWPAYLGLFQYRFIVTIVMYVFGFLEHLVRTFISNKKGTGALRIDLYGMKNGQQHHAMICGLGEMRKTTGDSLAVGALILGEKTALLTKQPGVYAPEGIVQPEEFVKRMRETGLTAFRDLEMQKPV